MRTPKRVRIVRVLLHVLCVPLLSLLLVACTISPISPITLNDPYSPLPTPMALVVPALDAAVVPNDAPMAYAPGSEVISTPEGVNPAFVGVYKSDVITWTGYSSGIEVITTTLSLFADGTYEQMNDPAVDTGDERVQHPLWFITGQWADLGDHGVLRSRYGADGIFATIGADGLAVNFPYSPFDERPKPLLLLKVSDEPEPLFACAAKAALQTAMRNRTRVIDAALVGHYAAPAQFFNEAGVVAPSITLFANGWVEYSINLVSDPDGYPPEWGLWSTTADPEPVITLSLTSQVPESDMLATERSYVWDGEVLTYMGDPMEGIFALPLVRTNEIPRSRMESVYNFLFPEPDATPPVLCRWEEE